MSKSGPRVTGVATFRLAAALAEPYLWAHGKVERREALLVRVSADGGFVGWGECAGAPGVAEAAVHDLLAPRLLGLDSLEIGLLWSRMHLALPPWERRGGALAALGGVDMALWDLAGQVRHCPSSALLGGRNRERIPVAWSGLYTGDGPELERAPRAIDEAREALEKGYRAIVVHLGRASASDALLVRRLREALPEAALLAEAHGALDLPEALALGRALDEASFSGFIEPLAPELGSLATLAAGLRVPLWAGRGVQGKADGLRLLSGGGVATLALHPGWCGGPSEALALRHLAHAHGVNVAFRTSGTLIAFAAALHLASTDTRTPGRTESAATPIEWDGVYDPLRDLLFFSGLNIEGGLADVPTTPGWGVAPEPESLRRVCTSERETKR